MDDKGATYTMDMNQYKLTREQLEKAQRDQDIFALQRAMTELRDCFTGDPLGNDHELNVEKARRVASRYAAAVGYHVPVEKLVSMLLTHERNQRAATSDSEIEEELEPTLPWGASVEE